MHLVAVLTLLGLSVMADSARNTQYSFSEAVGNGGGISFSIIGEGRITAIRVWEWSGNYITGFQFRYGFVWSGIVGHKEGKQMHELELFPGEAIVQISGKYANSIQSVVFTTNRGRSLFVGQPSGHSFNMYPENKDAELCFINGQYHGSISSLASHWAVINTDTY